MEMTADYLRARVRYDSETGEFRWLPLPSDDTKSRLWNERKAGQIAGRVLSNGYRYLWIGGKSHLIHRLAWLYVYGKMPDAEVDHIDGVRDNNAIANLRPASRAQNARNRRVQSNNTSGYRGVVRHHNKWRAKINVDGRRKLLGDFYSPEEAAAAYADAALRLYGEFVRIE